MLSLKGFSSLRDKQDVRAGVDSLRLRYRPTIAKSDRGKLINQTSTSENTRRIDELEVTPARFC